MFIIIECILSNDYVLKVILIVNWAVKAAKVSINHSLNQSITTMTNDLDSIESTSIDIVMGGCEHLLFALYHYKPK